PCSVNNTRSALAKSSKRVFSFPVVLEAATYLSYSLLAHLPQLYEAFEVFKSRNEIGSVKSACQPINKASQLTFWLRTKAVFLGKLYTLTLTPYKFDSIVLCKYSPAFLASSSSYVSKVKLTLLCPKAF